MKLDKLTDIVIENICKKHLHYLEDWVLNPGCFFPTYHTLSKSNCDEVLFFSPFKGVC